MQFNSYTFIFLFLPLGVLVFHGLARRSNRAAMAWLGAVSLAYYGLADLRQLPLILVSAVFNFAVGRQLRQRPSRVLFAAGVTGNLLFLGWFKYAGFAAGIWTGLTGMPSLAGPELLPLGVSFFTFQQIAYLIDMRDRQGEANDWLEHLVFITFFPVITAGPIVHSAAVIAALRRQRRGLWTRLAVGLTYFIVGLFKKTVIANGLAAYVDPVFTNAAAGIPVTFLEAWGGTSAFTLQLYFDFSGYSDMAIGVAHLFGVRLPANFDSPLAATSIIAFWQRWHMTLTAFVNAYVYNPLALRAIRRRIKAGKGVDPAKTGDPGAFLHLMVWPTMASMVLLGLWHGAGWTFVVFGAYNGLLLVINHGWRLSTRKARWKKRVPARVGAVFGWLLTFIAVAVGLAVFRSADMTAALNMLAGLPGTGGRAVFSPGYQSFLPLLKVLFPQVTISSAPLPAFFGREQVAWTAAAMAIVLIAPNTQTIMARYQPVLAGKRPLTAPNPALFPYWRPTLAWAAISVLLLALSLVETLSPSEFLYQRF